MSGAADDAVFMRRAIDLALSRMGETWPNPAVGCVLVKDGVVLAEAAPDAPAVRDASRSWMNAPGLVETLRAAVLELATVMDLARLEQEGPERDAVKKLGFEVATEGERIVLKK